MSEPKLISPLLDNHIIGAPISDRNGVRSCPAITKDNNEKYIVKIVSIPSSQSKLDALLLTGAYPDKESALAYFKELSEEVAEEATVLQKLSHLEGFLSFDAWQTEPMEDGTGYDVYLLRPYYRTLDQQIRRNTMTHLAAVNLGIDICSALSVCQRSGYLYADLKPTNIIYSEDKQYLIGDLGFLRMDSLKYASLPDKYRSAYTAPEIADAYSSINPTLSIYAAGMILYQVFNGGTLPFDGENAPAETFDPPVYADYEMAEIIAKAIAPDPADRWQTPAEMGQALVSYMQRNPVNETPIIPPVVPVVDEPEDEEASGAFEADKTTEEAEAAEGEAMAETAEEAAEEDAKEDAEEAAEEADSADVAEDLLDADAIIEEVLAESAEESEAEVTVDDCGNLSFLDEMSNDDTAPGEEDEVSDYSEISEEVSDILEQADDLIAHETPDPVIAPEPIEVTIPEPIVIEQEPAESEAEADSCDDSSLDETIVLDASETAGEQEEETAEEEEVISTEAPQKPAKKGTGKIIARIFIILLIAAGLVLGGLYLYQNYYLQRIDNLELRGENDTLYVIVDSDIEEGLLSVVCSDIYGNQLSAPVVNNVATFTELTSGKTYHIEVAIDGFHAVTGATHDTYQSPAITTINNLSILTGAQDASVILLFNVEGPDSENWKVTYACPGEEEKELIFTGHSVTISDLTVGSEYTFKIEPETPLYIDEEPELNFTAQNVVIAEDLVITECADRRLSATWNCPEDVQVDKWLVRYICNDGAEETVATTETSVVFENIDHTLGYTVEVTADGMSLNTRANVMAGAMTVYDLTAAADGNDLKLTWNSSSEVGENGWLLQYTIDGSETKYTITATGNEALIEPRIPGATYAITLSCADGSQVLNGELEYTAEEAEEFDDSDIFVIGAGNYFIFSMCKTPSFSGWDRHDIEDEDYTTIFSADENASFVVRLRGEYNGSSKEMEVLYVIRTADGEFVSCATDSSTWNELFYKAYCELDVPSIPNVAGEYNITIYFNSAYAGEEDFTISA